MTTRMAYAQQSVARCLERMERTAADVAPAIRGRSDELLGRRPAPMSWAAKEVVCHLRDIEELFLLRFRTMLASHPARAPGVTAPGSDTRGAAAPAP